MGTGQGNRAVEQTATPQDAGTGVSRRGFLSAAGATAAAVAAPGALASAASAHGGGGHHGHHRDRIPRDHISIQLYTLRDQLAIDFQGTLNALRAIGYRRVEHAGFVGRTAAEFKAALDAAGLRATSGHVLIPQPFNAAAWRPRSPMRSRSAPATSCIRSSASTSGPAR